MTPGKINPNDNSSNVDVPTSSFEGNHNNNESPSNEVLDNRKLTFVSTCDISSTTDKNENGTKPKEVQGTKSELLGSLTSMSSPAVRTSARVIQKMKMDSIRPTTPPPVDKRDATKDEHHRPTQKTPNQNRPSRANWSNAERTLFFDALNEYGKEFEMIANYVNSKQKRKNSSDPSYKAKEHVRVIYYQTFQKIIKYLRFSEDVPKKVQELYALINYGEMRKKIPSDNQKFYMKLRELVCRGSVTWRSKGKNYRIKTPSCPALRRINQVEKWQEDIKLPAKVDVEIKPADNESWYTVQSLAQNPRVKTSLPLQKRLISLIKTLQQKWKSREAKMIDLKAFAVKKEQSISTATPTLTTYACSSDNNASDVTQSQFQSNPMSSLEPVLCIAPPFDVPIHRPYVNLTDFLNSYSICLNSYEKRIDAKVRSESLCAEHMNNVKEAIKSHTKRQRHDSGSEKKSPDMKRTKCPDGDKYEHEIMKKVASSTSQDGMSTTSTEDLAGSQDDRDRDFLSPTNENACFDLDGVNHMPELSSADECERDELINKFRPEPHVDEINLAADIRKDHGDQKVLTLNKGHSKKTEPKTQLNLNRKRVEIKSNNRDSFRPLIREETIQKIRQGWTSFNVGDITIGDLYIMFGQESKLRLEYKWIQPMQQIEIKTESAKMIQKVDGTLYDGKDMIEEDMKSENISSNALSTSNADEMIDTKPSDSDVKQRNTLSNKLKQLLSLAGMMEKTKRKTSCACGHYCDRGMNKVKKDDAGRSFISNKTYPSTLNDSSLFRQPVLPHRTGHAQHFEPYRLNMNATRTKPRAWLKSRNNRVSKQVVVQRLLPLQPGITQPYSVLATTDVAPVKNTMIRPVPTSGLTKENLDRMNNLRSTSPKPGTSGMNGNSTHGNQTSDEEDEDDDEDVADDDDDDDGDVLEMGNQNNEENHCCDNVDSGNDERSACEPSDEDHLDSDDEETNRMRQRINNDPGIQSLMEISLPSPISIVNVTDDYYIDSNSQPPASPMGILRESPVPAASRWFEENMNDFSLSSFLGHLESNCDQANGRRSRSRSPNRKVDSSNLSTISETSIDYMSRFEELAESMKNDANNIIIP